MRDQDVEGRVRRLEDIEAIQAVHYAYLRAVDKLGDGVGLDRAALQRVLADEVVWRTESGPADESAGAEGAESVITLLTEMMSSFDVVQHGIQNLHVEVDGDTARGTGAQWVRVRMDGVDDTMYARVSSGYVRSETGWRISELVMRVPPPPADA